MIKADKIFTNIRRVIFPLKDRGKSRPCSVTLLALVVLMFAGLNLERLVQAIWQWEFLNKILPISPLYLALSGLIWALIGFTLAFLLWVGASFAPRFTYITAFIYTMYYWFNRLILFDREWLVNWLFVTIINIISIVTICWIFSQRKTKTYFGEGNEHKPKN